MPIDDDPDVAKPRRRRRSQGPEAEDLASLPGQREWLGRWVFNRPSGARRSASRYLNQFERRVGQVETDDVVAAAVEATYRKVNGRLERRGAVVPVRGGFPRYCETVLRNEIRRQLNRRAKKTARRLGPSEVLTVRVEASSSRAPLPLRAAGQLKVAVSFSVRTWDRHLLARQQREAHLPALRVGPRAAPLELWAEMGAVDGLAEEVLEVGDGTIRVENPGVVAVHATFRVLGYLDPEGWHELKIPVRVLDTARGIGLQMGKGEGVFLRQEPSDWRRPSSEPATDGIALPETPEDMKMRRPGPRKVPPRSFSFCPWIPRLSPEDVLHDLTLVLEESAICKGGSGWLQPEHVLAGAVRALEATGHLKPEVICRLAEWDEPGLHRPHVSGHPGRHPLDDDVRRAVLGLQGEYGGPASANAASQARSRLAKRVQHALAQAGHTVHAQCAAALQPHISGSSG